MATGVLTNELVEDFPPTTRPGSGNHAKQTTDVDVALNTLVERLTTHGDSPVLKFLDYNVETDSETGATKEVDSKLARQRASGRIPQIKGRGYSTENGWVIAARNGALYAKYFGPGNVPDEFIRKEKAVGEAVPV